MEDYTKYSPPQGQFCQVSGSCTKLLGLQLWSQYLRSIRSCAFSSMTPKLHQLSYLLVHLWSRSSQPIDSTGLERSCSVYCCKRTYHYTVLVKEVKILRLLIYGKFDYVSLVILWYWQTRVFVLMSSHSVSFLIRPIFFNIKNLQPQENTNTERIFSMPGIFWQNHK